MEQKIAASNTADKVRTCVLFERIAAYKDMDRESSKSMFPILQMLSDGLEEISDGDAGNDCLERLPGENLNELPLNEYKSPERKVDNAWSMAASLGHLGKDCGGNRTKYASFDPNSPKQRPQQQRNLPNFSWYGNQKPDWTGFSGVGGNMMGMNNMGRGQQQMDMNQMGLGMSGNMMGEGMNRMYGGMNQQRQSAMGMGGGMSQFGNTGGVSGHLLGDLKVNNTHKRPQPIHVASNEKYQCQPGTFHSAMYQPFIAYQKPGLNVMGMYDPISSPQAHQKQQPVKHQNSSMNGIGGDGILNNMRMGGGMKQMDGGMGGIRMDQQRQSEMAMGNVAIGGGWNSMGYGQNDPMY